MNLVIIKGRLTADVTMRSANSGTQIAGFTLAVDRRFKDKVSGNKITDFIRCTAFGKTAEFLGRYTNKGKEILVEGELQQNDYTAQDGHEVKSYQVIVNQVHFCGSKSDTAQSAPEQPVSAEIEQFAAEVSGEIENGTVPF